MSVRVLRGGLQTTIQATPRVGQRHMGVPRCGPADPLSMALANLLVRNPLQAPALEATLTGVDLEFETESWFAITGATSTASLHGRTIDLFATQHAEAGQVLRIGAAVAGARVYVAVDGGFAGDDVLGSQSTYLPAAFGGYEGRALAEGDQVPTRPTNGHIPKATIPPEFRPPMTNSWALRACHGGDIDRLEAQSSVDLFNTNFVVGNRADRMGLQLEGPLLETSSGGRLPSAPVFPGCVQCPENGTPFILGADAQTTGGYPRVAQICRADRHLLGQLRPGSHVRLLVRTPRQARDDLREKIDYWGACLPGVEAVI